MNKFEALLSELQDQSITQQGMDWAESLTNDMWNTHFKGNFKELKSNLDVDTHRWYETSVSIIEIYGKLLGIRHVSNTFSESMMVDDCDVTLQFMEMEEFTTVDYREKNKE